MKSHRKRVVIMLIALGVFSGLTLSGCAGLKNDNEEPLNREETNAVAAIERQKNYGNMTTMEADIEKDAAGHNDSLTF